MFGEVEPSGISALEKERQRAEEDVEESTEFPTEEEPTSTEDLSDFKDVTVDSGEYTTYIFQYENEQYMGLDNPNEKCFDDFTKCVTSLSYVNL
ncbi:hypothetical protein MSG28_014198 [Choristoneura fumiferana]|uniref:Uncharacterized protein n=1 Tax=Choristoneura fumiferana TaxID=7141 RepID=A0ACC0JG53_CHOFU|nr:hypothetical protein MSG28_014198 [Choristoneura fumiferana]